MGHVRSAEFLHSMAVGENRIVRCAAARAGSSLTHRVFFIRDANGKVTRTCTCVEECETLNGPCGAP